MELLIHYKVGQSLLHIGTYITKKSALLQNGIYKLWHELMQNGAGNLLQSWSIVIAKCITK